MTTSILHNLALYEATSRFASPLYSYFSNLHVATMLIHFRLASLSNEMSFLIVPKRKENNVQTIIYKLSLMNNFRIFKISKVFLSFSHLTHYNLPSLIVFHRHSVVALQRFKWFKTCNFSLVNDEH